MKRYVIEDEKRLNMLHWDDYLDDSSAVIHAIQFALARRRRVALLTYTSPADHGRVIGRYPKEAVRANHHC
jgi:hypothetical protein